MPDPSHERSMAVLVTAGRLLVPGADQERALRALIDLALNPEHSRLASNEIVGSPESFLPDGAAPESFLRRLIVFSEAVELFGDERAALEWWSSPLVGTADGKNRAPKELAGVPMGAMDLVERIRRTREGIF